MILNKKYFPSYGFIILFITLSGAVYFVNWALEPFSYEKAMNYEQKGHKFAANGNLKESSKYFLKAAEIEDDKKSTSRRYRCAGTTSQTKIQKIKYFKLALKYNPENKIAKNELNKLLQEYKYINRFDDGWSNGKNATIIVNVKENKNNYSLKYFVSSPYKEPTEVKFFVDAKLITKDSIISHKPYLKKLNLSQGQHIIKLQVNKTFNPEKLNMSQDNRNLGINFTLIKKEEINE